MYPINGTCSTSAKRFSKFLATLPTSLHTCKTSYCVQYLAEHMNISDYSISDRASIRLRLRRQFITTICYH